MYRPVCRHAYRQTDRQALYTDALFSMENVVKTFDFLDLEFV